MDEITGPIIAITLVLSSVFLPSAFIPGITGQFYRQFALTIAASMILSATNAMTMTPARATAVFGHRKPGVHHEDGGHEALPWWGVVLLAGTAAVWLLGGLAARLLGITLHEEGPTPASAYAIYAVLFAAGAVLGWTVVRPVNGFLAVLFRGFNRVFDWVTERYGRMVGRCLRLCVIVLFIYGGMIGLTVFGFMRVPVGFIPDQDKGYLVCNIQLPDSASLERTVAITEQVEKIALATPGVDHAVAIPGQSIILNAVSSNFSSIFFTLKPFEERHGEAEGADAIAESIRQKCAEQIRGAIIGIFGAPPVDGLGNASGFKLMVEDRGDNTLEELQGQADNLALQANRQPGLVGVFDSFRADTPQMFADVNRERCKKLNVDLSDVFNTLQVLLGGYYVNDFNKFGRTWQVNAQADGPFRISAATARQFQVRSQDGNMVSLGAVANIRDSSGPVMITRYNMYPAATINGGSLPDVSSGTVIKTMEALAGKQLTRSMVAEWTELTFMQKLAGGTAAFAFIGAVVLVFLVLAAQYESWSMPLAVILVVPMCLLCAVAGVALAGMDINIFVQVGFIVLVGLASKNAILVVEFARERQQQGVSLFDATVEAATVRLRPIIMTSFAFILGVVPLVVAKGAGAEMRSTLGVAVFSGMIGVTLFGIFLTPVFYYVIGRFVPVEQKKPAEVVKTPAVTTQGQATP